MTKKKEFDLLFLGHTDVVPVNFKYWCCNPFKFNLKDGFIFSRGICDMKGSIYSLFICVRLMLKFRLSISIVIILSGDEEGDSNYGAKEVVKRLRGKFTATNCIIGEPTSYNRIVDVVRNGRRGSLNFAIRLTGVQYHNAYPLSRGNLCKSLYSFLYTITNFNGHFYNIKVNGAKSNVTPISIDIYVNLRYSSKNEVLSLIDSLKVLSIDNTLRLSFKKISNSKPFYKLSTVLLNVIKDILPLYLVKIERYSGGTSDGRFVRKLSRNMIEIGLKNSTIHSNNECSSLRDIYMLSLIYFSLFVNLFVV
ncbi:M20/M25/M40 family metallo-hydrolase [Candidatus Vidania fulgoroideorum]